MTRQVCTSIFSAAFNKSMFQTQNIAINEAMCVLRDQPRFKVYYLKEKNVSPSGIKFYQLRETCSGYVYWFEIYASDPNINIKLTDDVLRLFDPYSTKATRDNYYTHSALCDMLVQRGTSCTGTI
ncbi:hypothetical protein PoB_003711700 [Plakobranchus ocellatus]|uniref:PiggyBac transposable element-derived protein domain-containing protein n=1 Tax=Plakobranchus ocellatus TaxID=259542 RepID=A0AAV4ATH5_9GAST|nr:hypothetical protein PoB_003711700 [Plakobranchus ocellatus]